MAAKNRIWLAGMKKEHYSFFKRIQPPAPVQAPLAEDPLAERVQRRPIKEEKQLPPASQAYWGGIWFKSSSLDWDPAYPDEGCMIQNAMITKAKIGIQIEQSSPLIMGYEYSR